MNNNEQKKEENLNAGKIIKKIFIDGKLEALTGLHIGGSDTGLSVGGVDNVVIRCVMKNNQPYIPGSSLKGKMRSLIEKTSDCRFDTKTNKNFNGPCQDPDSETGKLFGVAANNKGVPSRIIVRDGFLLNPDDLEKAKTDMPYTEIKTETVIDRITSAANPRQLERVPAGAIFDLHIILNILEEDNETNEQEYLNAIFKALTLIEDDYLGGYGSRGSGQVKFKDLNITFKDRNIYKENQVANQYTDITIPEQLKGKK